MACPCGIRVCGKSRRERCLPLWKNTAKDLRAWLAVRGPVRTSELFVNAAGDPRTRAGFEYVLEKHVKVAAEKLPDLKGPRQSPKTGHR
jgi:integrase/recombinase XerD